MVDSNRLDAGCIGKYEDTGTLSHRLIVELARFEEEMAQEGRILPKWEPRKRPRLKETDAERQIAFSQEQRREMAENVGDNKRTAEDDLGKVPCRRAAESKDRRIVSRSIRRSISRVRQSKDRNIVQEESHEQRESIKKRGRRRRSRSVGKRIPRSPSKES